MNTTKTIAFWIGLFAVLVIAGSAVYVVDETEQVVITQFGKPVGETISEPGMKFKIPFIQQANYFDNRYLEWDGDRNQVPTKDKKFIFVDSYARWEITDPLKFFQRLRDESGGQSRLDDILDGETRNTIASHDLLEVVRSSNRQVDSAAIITDVIDITLEDIEIGRDSIQVMILESANARSSDLGIQILDFRFKRIKYVEEVQQRVYERMISERNRIAEKFRSEGRGEAASIGGEREKELDSIESKAMRTAAETRGRADAEAAAIFNRAYNRNNSARELYEFVKTMETYEDTFTDETSVILSTDSDFFKYLKSID